MSFERFHLQPFRQRIEEPRKFIQVIVGPRQVGKTTMVLQLLKNSKVPNYFVSADGTVNSNKYWVEQQWEIARLKKKQAEANEFIFVIDEIQKIDNWSEAIKKQWDYDTNNNIQIKIIILVSSRLLIQQGLTESLAGRFETTYLGHWSFLEMNQAFNWSVNQFVWFGGYPGSASIIDDENRWKKYIIDSLIETSISKDILMLTRVDKPALMKRLFELGCLYSGQILSYTKMLGQLLDAGNTVTLAHYLDLLDTAGLLAGIEKYSNDKLRQRSSSPKFQVHNTALISAQHYETLQSITNKPDAWGRIVESAVGAHLINNSLITGYKMHYWRKGNDEVDFVLEYKRRIIGLEIKSGNSKRASGIQAFERECSPERIIIIGSSGLPWRDFLKMNPVDLFS